MLLPGLDWTPSYWPPLWAQQQEGLEFFIDKIDATRVYKGAGVLTPTIPVLVFSTMFPPAMSIAEALGQLL